MRRTRLGCVALTALLGCGGGIPLEDVPSAPIAFVRQEPAQGLVDLKSFQDALRLRLPGVEEERPREPRTTLSLLVVPTGEIRAVPDAGLGSVPFDWSTDGTRLLLGRREGPRRPLRLFSWDRQSQIYRRLTPDWSAGSAALGDGPIRLARVGRVMRHGRPSTLAIWIYTDVEGDHALAGGEEGSDPDVAPDGQSVIFVRPSPRANRDPIMLKAKLGEREPRPIGQGSQPSFSRDGAWVAFVRHRAGSADVWLMRSNGSGKRPIARSSYDEEFPCVSPHGRYVVYASARGEEEASQLFMTRVADGVEIQLTHNGQNSRPVW